MNLFLFFVSNFLKFLFNQIFLSYNNININPIQPRYNVVNNIPTQTQINSNQQILPPSTNIIKYSPNQNTNMNHMNQFQALNHKTSNYI